MTQDGGIPLPPGANTPSPAATRSAPAAVVVRAAPVERLPPSLSSLDVAQQIEARVAEIRAQTQEIVLRTQWGDIIVKAQAQTQLTAGSNVTVELAAGDPPATATIRLVPSENIKIQTPDLPPATSPEIAPQPAQLPPPPPDLDLPAILVELKAQMPSRPSVASSSVSQATEPLPLDVEKAVAELKGFLLSEEPRLVQQKQETAFTDEMESLTPRFPPAQNLTRQIPVTAETGILKIALELKTITQSITATPPGKNPAGNAPSILTSSLPLTFSDAGVPLNNILDSNISEVISAKIHTRLASAGINAFQTIGTTPASTPASGLAVPDLRHALSASLLGILEPQHQGLMPAATMETKTSEQSIANAAPAPPASALKIAQVKIISILPPAPTPDQIHAALAEIKSKGPAQGLGLAKSMGKTPTGQILLETSKGHMIVQTASHAIGKGSIVITQTAPEAQVPTMEQPTFLSAAGLAGFPLADFDPLTSHSWSALEETLRTLSSHAALTAAASALRNALPTPSPRLVPTALFFLAALKGGIIENWLGDKNLAALKEAGHQKLVERLSSDFGKLAGQAGETLPGDWKAIPMPLLHDENVSQMMFLIRHQQAETDTTDKGNGSPRQTRFVLNLSLSRLGDMQLDGLFRQGQLDVILRTRAPLPGTMQNELTQKYTNAMEQTRLAGQIRFQTKGWVEMPPATALKTAGIVA